MDAARKNNDCYFYYYSTCLKGDGCTFRHEPSALGSETVCSFWAQGKCMNLNCNFRHMELKKNRKTIPCYWESQPSGCQKSHCSFQHKSPRQGIPGENNQSNDCDVGTVQQLERPDYRQRRSIPGDGGESSEGEGSRRLTQDYTTTIVDPLVVNFEEESDNESVPTSSPTKKIVINRAKTLEEMHLERIQAESAAYYSYEDLGVLPPRDSGFRIMSLAEIRANKMDTDSSDSASGNSSRVVKTAMQIRAERKARDELNVDSHLSSDRCKKGTKRKQETIVRSYKKRAHSPIKFGTISYAVPSVNYRMTSSVEPLVKAVSLVDDKTEKEVNVSTRDKTDNILKCEIKPNHVDSNPPAVKLRRPSITSPSRVRLRRAQPVSVVNQPSILTLSTTNNSSTIPTMDRCMRSGSQFSLNLPFDSNNVNLIKSEFDTTDGNSVDSGTLSDLLTTTSHHKMHMAQVLKNIDDRNELSFDVSSDCDPSASENNDVPNEKNVSVNGLHTVIVNRTHIDCQSFEDSSVSAVCEKLNSRYRDDLLDEEMLLEDTTLQPEDSILQEDIDALLDD